MDDSSTKRGQGFLDEQAAKLIGDEADPLNVKEWPILPPEALHGLAGDAVRLATADCEADPAAVLITFLAWFGCACGQPDGSTPYLRIGETRHAPRLFAAVVGASSRARKGTSKYPVQRLMEEAHLFASSCIVSLESNNTVTNARSSEKPSPSNYEERRKKGGEPSSSFTKKEERRKKKEVGAPPARDRYPVARASFTGFATPARKPTTTAAPSIRAAPTSG